MYIFDNFFIRDNCLVRIRGRINSLEDSKPHPFTTSAICSYCNKLFIKEEKLEIHQPYERGTRYVLKCNGCNFSEFLTLQPNIDSGRLLDIM